MIEQGPGRLRSLISAAMTKTGFSPTSLAITSGIVVLGVAGHMADQYFLGLKKYEEGYQAAIADQEEAQIDLDVKTDEYFEELYDFSGVIDAEIEIVQEEYEEETDNAVTELQTTIDDHGEAIQRLQRSQRPRTAWGSAPVPNDVRLRFKRRDAERKRDSVRGRDADRPTND